MVTVVTGLMKENVHKSEILEAVNKAGYQFKRKKITKGRLDFTIKTILDLGLIDSYVPSKVRDRERQAEIKVMLENGEKLVTIAKKYGFSKARSQQISKKIGINPKTVRQTQRNELAKNIKADVKQGVSYCGIKDKYDVGGKDLHYLSKVVKNFDCTYTNTLAKRNDKIVKTFKKGATADEIAKSGLCNVGSIGGVFGVLKSAGVKRYPHIKRNAGGWNDDPKVMALIREYNETGFNAINISEILNKKGLKTQQGVKFTSHNVLSKIRAMKNGQKRTKK